jgi:hypothetical protein
MCCEVPAREYLAVVLDHIVTEAHATMGSLRPGVAVSILILDRVERNILTRQEGIDTFRLAPDVAFICGAALLTRRCPHGHEWVGVRTLAGEPFTLLFVKEAHRA